MIVPQQSPKEARNRVLLAEAIGILILAIIGFAFVILRHGRFLNWHVR
jgi:preprotein translocase subunit Sss1